MPSPPSRIAAAAAIAIALPPRPLIAKTIAARTTTAAARPLRKVSTTLSVCVVFDESRHSPFSSGGSSPDVTCSQRGPSPRSSETAIITAPANANSSARITTSTRGPAPALPLGGGAPEGAAPGGGGGVPPGGGGGGVWPGGGGGGGGVWLASMSLPPLDECGAGQPNQRPSAPSIRPRSRRSRPGRDRKS